MYRFLSGLLLFASLYFMGQGCSGDPPAPASGSPAVPVQTRVQSGMQSVSPSQAMKMIGERDNLILVDVRTSGELRTGIIEGSIAVPFGAVMKGDHTLPKGNALLLICAVGGRSYAASQILARSGYSEVYNLSGGIHAWKKAGLPLKN